MVTPRCGPFSYCDVTEAVPTCKCPDGFEPNGSTPSGGCARKEMLRCGDGDHFTTLPHVKTPAMPVFVRNRSSDGCAAECLGNCSCKAYAYANMSSAMSGGDPSRCLLWFGELVDMGKYTDIDGEDLYLRLAGSTENQLTQGKPLFHGDELISEGGDFTLGFFSPTNNSSARLYIGIWKGHTLWTSSANNATAGGAGAAAVLLSSGNFVLRSSNGTEIWQSFDHPTDTILPTMRAMLRYKAQTATRFFAWKGPDDPSTGDISGGVDLDSNLQFFIWNGTVPYCRATVFNDASLSSSTYQSNATSIFYQAMVNTGDEFYYTFSVSAGSPYTRISLDYTGKMRLLSWNSKASAWAVISEDPGARCDLYTSCGPFGYCDNTAPVPACRCLDGFVPIDAGNFSRGCKRMEALTCVKKTHFVTVPGMKVPDKFVRIRNTSFDQCAAKCSANCSCTAYAYANMSSADTTTDTSRCLVWTGDLVDMGKAGFEENLYLRLADSSGTRQKKKAHKRMMLEYLRTTNETGDKNIEFPFISFEDIVVATDNFSDSNMLGKGGFDSATKSVLLWPTRFKIIQGIARGLMYLHHDSRLTIIHRDLKAGNILLDKEMSPKISDFGMARIFCGDQLEANTNRVVGTYGYMSPEYAMEGAFSVKSDTYSFGVLLLEIVSGLKISSPHLIVDFPNLIVYAWNLWKDGKTEDLVDSSVNNDCSLDEVSRCIHIGLLCVQDSPDCRPLMSAVVFMLENKTTPLPLPIQPVYFAHRDAKPGQTNDNRVLSVNKMSLTALEGR
ncbi:hypothetical protein EJB05_39791, partial [Eragrostis curvula]